MLRAASPRSRQDPSLVAEGHRGHGALRRHRRDPDDDRHPALAERIVRLAHGGRKADGLEGVLHPLPVGERPDLLDPVRRRAVDGVRGAQLPGEFELIRENIDRDDLLRAGDRRALDDVEADAARAEDGDAAAGSDARAVEHGADTGDHRAPEEGRAGRPSLQYSHVPQESRQRGMTWSPGLTEVTPGPTSATIPEPS